MNLIGWKNNKKLTFFQLDTCVLLGQKPKQNTQQIKYFTHATIETISNLMIGQKHEWQKGPGKKTIGKTEREMQNNKMQTEHKFRLRGQQLWNCTG